LGNEGFVAGFVYLYRRETAEVCAETAEADSRISMKICPKCQRNYTDDLSFCLEDGAQLATYAPQQKPSQEKTLILPGGIRSTEAPVSVRQTAIDGSTPAYSYPSPQLPEKRGGKLWVFAGSGVALVLVVFIALAGWFVWTARNKSTADSSQPASKSPNENPRDSNTPAAPPNVDSKSESQTAENNLEWLNGVWSGDAYQTDTKTRWAVRLTVRDDTYSIVYPDIPCKGTWKLIEKNSRSASFTEVITQGLDQCENNSRVMVEKLSASEITCRYAHPGSRAVIATVVLTKKD